MYFHNVIDHVIWNIDGTHFKPVVKCMGLQHRFDYWYEYKFYLSTDNCLKLQIGLAIMDNIEIYLILYQLWL